MEHYKISKLLIDWIVSREWIEVNDLSSGQYSDNKNIRFKTSVLKNISFLYKAKIMEQQIIVD